MVTSLELIEKNVEKKSLSGGLRHWRRLSQRNGDDTLAYLCSTCMS